MRRVLEADRDGTRAEVTTERGSRVTVRVGYEQIELTPDEGRELIRYLRDACSHADRWIRNHAE